MALARIERMVSPMKGNAMRILLAIIMAGLISGCKTPLPIPPSTTTTTTTTTTSTTQPEVIVEPAPESSGNNPDISSPHNLPSNWSHNTARNYGAGTAKQGQYHGVVKCANHDEATNLRYALRMHFEWDLNVFTAYPTPDRKGTGWVNIWIQDSDNTVRWVVNP
jgi:hypothetical protein